MELIHFKKISKIIRFLFCVFLCFVLLVSLIFVYSINISHGYLKNVTFFKKIYKDNLGYADNAGSKYTYQNYRDHELLNDSFISPIDVDKNLVYKKLYISGHSYYKSENYLRADSCFSRVSESSYILADYALYYLAKSNYEMGDYSSAIEYYDEYKNKYPGGYWKEKIELDKANCFHKLGEFLKMEEILKNFIRNFSSSGSIPDAMFQLSLCLEEQKKWEDAMENYYQIWLNFPLSEWANKAKEKFTKIIEIHHLELKPPNLVLLHQRAKKLIKAYLFNAALSGLLELEEKANLEGNTQLVSKVKLDIAICNFRIREYKKAITILSELLNSDISSDLEKEALFWLAKSHTYLGNTQNAIEYYSLLVEKYPYSDLAPESLENIANIWENKNYIEKAMNTYGEIIKKYPYTIFAKRALWNTGWISYKNMEYSRALEKFDKLAKISSKNSSFFGKALYWKSKTLEKLNKNDLAILSYRDIVNENSYDFYRIMAMAKLEEIDPDWTLDLEAKDFGNKDLEDKNYSEHYKKAKELFTLDFYEDAMNELEIEEEEHNNKKLMLEVSNLFFKTGNYHSSIKIAVNYLNELLSDEPQGEVKNIWKQFYPRGYHNFVEIWSEDRDINPFLIYSVIREESHFNPSALSISNARGLMQIIPSTGKWIAEKIGFQNFYTERMWDIETNIKMGSWYLRFLLDYFGGRQMLAVAGYNAGQGAVERWLKKTKYKEPDFFIEDISYEQTREYVKKVFKDYVIYHQIYSKDDLSISTLVNNFMKL
jgi:soluble lytic murein transglycosylase